MVLLLFTRKPLISFPTRSTSGNYFAEQSVSLRASVCSLQSWAAAVWLVTKSRWPFGQSLACRCSTFAQVAQSALRTSRNTEGTIHGLFGGWWQADVLYYLSTPARKFCREFKSVAHRHLRRNPPQKTASDWLRYLGRSGLSVIILHPTDCQLLFTSSVNHRAPGCSIGSTVDSPPRQDIPNTWMRSVQTYSEGRFALIRMLTILRHL